MSGAKMSEHLHYLREEGTKAFSKVQKSDKKLYGKTYGNKDLIAFAKYIDPDFLDPTHIQLISDALTKVNNGEIKRLIINMPPRHGKSQLCSKIFPTWYLGNHPKSNIILSSYAATLAEDFTRWQRNTCESPIYRDVFPELYIKQDSRAKDQWQTVQGGNVIGAGVGGPITGRGADLAIIDDPIKNYEEAKSEIIQDKIWDWYQSTLRTRLHPGAAVILIMTRWVTFDLAGRLLAQDKTIENGGTWHLLKLPAIDVKGNALWEGRYSANDILQIRKEVGEKIFSALYQQEPIDIQERLFNDPIFAEPPENIRTIAYLDPAFGGSDYSAMTIGGLHESNGIRIHVIAGEIWNESLDKTYDKVESLCKKYNVSKLYLEANQSQKALGYELEKRGIIIGLINNYTNKYLRIVNAVKINWEKIRFSKNVSNDYLKQILHYHEDSRHDDAPDSLAGFIERFPKVSGKDLNKRYSFVNFFRFKI
jgi:predicted phage terminase large subunit-like protein